MAKPKTKEFDAVEEMRSIRAKLSAEMAGRSYEEQQRILSEYTRKAGLESKFPETVKR